MALATSGTNYGTTVALTGTNSQVFYTVPSGKTFVGHIWNNSSNGIGWINGVRFYWSYSNSYFVHPRMEVTLTEGTTVTADNSGTTMLLGVEV